MSELLFWAAVLCGAWWLLAAVRKDGKRAGSRKAFGVGLRRGRGRGRRCRRCRR